MSFKSDYQPQNWRDVVFFQILKSKLSWVLPDSADFEVTVIRSEDLSRVMGNCEPPILCDTSPNVTSKVRVAHEWAPNGKADKVFVTFGGEPFRVPWYFRLLRMLHSDIQDFFVARYRALSLAKEAWSLWGEVEGVDRIFAFIDPSTFRVAAYGEKSSINQGDKT